MLDFNFSPLPFKRFFLLILLISACANDDAQQPINNILAKIEANHAGVDDALMLDIDGFVSETNATNIYMIKDKIVYTPFPKACLPGITRQTVIDICQSNNIPIIEKDISVTEMYNADEVFSTGTMGELARVEEIDKRKIENKGDTLSNLQSLFLSLIHI